MGALAAPRQAAAALETATQATASITEITAHTMEIMVRPTEAEQAGTARKAALRLHRPLPEVPGKAQAHPPGGLTDDAVNS